MCENGAEYTDSVDPRVHIELERLNNATDEINRLEVGLDEARNSFRQLLCDSTAKVDSLRVKLGMCVERAKPYYEARFIANEALKHTQIAAMKYERANSAHSAAREMVYLAEQGLGGRTLDPAWQEMLNHATQRVNDAERDRGIAGTEHRIACVKHETTNAKVQQLQKELKRAIAKSRPYYEMKAHFNQLLEQQKSKVQHFESQVSAAKLTYAKALRNLEQISDEIHQNRRKLLELQLNKQTSLESNESLLSDAQEFVIGNNRNNVVEEEEEEEYKNLPLNNEENHFSNFVGQNYSNEWTEISLDYSSPEEDYSRKVNNTFNSSNDSKPKLTKQKTLPNSTEFAVLKNKIKLDTNIANWISRSSAKNQDSSINNSRRQSLDNILGPTSEKVKEIFSQGIMMLNISSLTERRNSEPKLNNEAKLKISNCAKKIPSPLEKTMTYLTPDDDNSDTESLSSVDMLNEEQINCLMLDKDISNVCEQVLGTTISEVVTLSQCASTSQSK